MESPYTPARAAWQRSQVPQIGRVKQHNLFSTDFWRLKSKVKVLAKSCFAGAPPFGMQMAIFLMCPHMGMHLSVS